MVPLKLVKQPRFGVHPSNSRLHSILPFLWHTRRPFPKYILPSFFAEQITSSAPCCWWPSPGSRASCWGPGAWAAAGGGSWVRRRDPPPAGSWPRVGGSVTGPPSAPALFVLVRRRLKSAGRRRRVISESRRQMAAARPSAWWGSRSRGPGNLKKGQMGLTQINENGEKKVS